MFNRLRALILTVLPTLCVCCTSRTKVPLDTLVVALDAQPATLDPRFATDATGIRISGLIFEGLVRVGPKLEILPQAAESWSRRDHTYTFLLRPDLRFHNGRAVTVEDVEFSFKQFLSPSSPFASSLDNMQDVQVKDVTLPNSQTRLAVIINTKRLSERFLRSEVPTIKILPKAELLANDKKFSAQLIGTGGFRFARQDASEIELTGVRSASKHLLFKIIHDDFTRYQKVLKGEIDIAQMEIGPDRVHEFQQRPQEFQVFVYPGLSMTYLLLSFRDLALRKKAVRRALAQSISRDELILYKMKGLAREATSLLSPVLPYHNAKLKNLPYQLELAQQSVRALGLQGHEFILKTSNSPQAIDSGKVLAYQMSQSGLKVKLQSYEWGTFYSDVKHGNFQLATMRWIGTLDPEIYRMAFHSKEVPPGRNRGSYINERLDQLLDQAVDAPDGPARKAVYDSVQALVHEDLAIIPLWYDEQIAITKKNVSHYSPSLNGDYLPLMEARKDYE